MPDPRPNPDSSAATFLFAHIAGFTALTEAHGDEEAAKLVADFCDAVEAELPSFGGTQIKTIGDALMLRIPDPGQAVLLGLGSLTTFCPAIAMTKGLMSAPTLGFTVRERRGRSPAGAAAPAAQLRTADADPGGTLGRGVLVLRVVGGGPVILRMGVGLRGRAERAEDGGDQRAFGLAFR